MTLELATKYIHSTWEIISYLLRTYYVLGIGVDPLVNIKVNSLWTLALVSFQP